MLENVKDGSKFIKMFKGKRSIVKPTGNPVSGGSGTPQTDEEKKKEEEEKKNQSNINKQQSPSTSTSLYNGSDANWDYFLNNYPHTLLGTSGSSVGLPLGQMGNWIAICTIPKKTTKPFRFTTTCTTFSPFKLTGLNIGKFLKKAQSIQ